ncbi:hypothetical protein M404DRAFT_787855 [Pisolithus tinctorius Marx 270]|uniref:Uncharacterized protein n=1 Tax=Pisolithus tinctorius Marx 270 TaxID=870435 RepID=A0A0C3PR62_PISTI|nr:hypothetical protein M404DRAFT_787855 [Pisolithus tinctorius Marx 270]
MTWRSTSLPLQLAPQASHDADIPNTHEINHVADLTGILKIVTLRIVGTTYRLFSGSPVQQTTFFDLNSRFPI